MGAACCDDGSAPRRAPRGSISKEEKKREKTTMAITKFLRFNVPKKTHKINKEEMDCFNGEDALKTLMESKYFVKNGTEIPNADREVGKFYTERDCLGFWMMLIGNKACIRGVKMYKDDKPVEGAKQKAVEDVKKEEDDTDAGTDVAKVDEEPKKKKRKFKVGMNQRQGFIPKSEEIYIWRYNPTPFMHWIYGAGVLLVVIGGTLFPLWPDQLRTGVYYGSVGLASFIGGILVVGFLRTILFGIIWAVTRGNHSLWILPNLLEDVGFFDSFKPAYTWEVKDDKAIKESSEEVVADDGDDEDEGESTEVADPETKKDQ